MPDPLSVPDAGPVLILTPTGRDAQIATRLLAEDGIRSVAVPSIDTLHRILDDSAGMILLADEALYRAELDPLARRIACQPPWSDIPVIVLTRGGGGRRRWTESLRLQERLGNVLYLERPLHAFTLKSAVETALRARQRQRQMRGVMAEQIIAAEQATALLEARVAERTRELEAEQQERRRIEATLAQSQRMEALGKLAAGIAHDFNNILQAVSGGAALIEQRADNTGRVQHLARMVADAVDRGASITGRLLAFARKSELNAVPVEPALLLENLRQILVPTLGSTIRIVLEVPDRAPSFMADQGQLETVLINLASNARDAMPNGGTLTISVESVTIADGAVHPNGLNGGAYVRLELRDTGSGMDAATLARAAEPFFTTKPVGQGTGLGLSMARGFAEQSGGALAIESTVGVGTSIILWFPQASQPGSVRPARDSAPLPEAASLRVLVVDDDSLVREVLVAQLQHSGFQVVEAPDGLAALEWLERDAPPDLLITDLTMPGMNGLALIREVRRRRRELPVMLLTGYADPALQAAIEQETEGTITLMRKPVRAEDLARRAVALLEG